MLGLPLNGQNIKLNFDAFETSELFEIDKVVQQDHLFNNTSLPDNTSPNKTYWIRLDFKGQDSILHKKTGWFLRFRNFDFGTLYYKDNGNIKSYKFGDFDSEFKGKSLIQSKKWFFPFKINELINNRFLFLKVRRVVNYEPINNWDFRYVSEKEKLLEGDYYSFFEVKRLIPVYVFAGLCLMIFLINLLAFINLKKKEFLFYALFILSLFLYLSGFGFNLNYSLFKVSPLEGYWFFEILQVVVNICYISFIIFYLETKKTYKRIHFIFRVLLIILCLLVVVDGLFFFMGYYKVHLNLLIFQRYFTTSIGVATIAYLYFNAKNRLTNIVILGSFLFMLGALGSWLYRGIMFMVTGGFLEIVVFGYGLIYKVRQGYKERLRYEKESYINSHKALRAQINPHFLFNSLSSIQHLVTKNDRVAAIKYLSKFSSLTRSVLESSIETKVLLSDEIKLINNYLELEALRFEEVFDYSISTDDNIEINTIEIPSMILQPFIENAIIHGLLLKPDEVKTLHIRFTRDDDILICEIEDNGIGREAAAKRMHIHKREKKSRGLEVTKQRLAELNNSKNSIEIIDKLDNSGNALGTTVIVRIPI